VTVSVVYVFTVDGEDIGRKDFRRAQNVIKSGGGERKMTDVINNSDNNIFKRHFPHENIN